MKILFDRKTKPEAYAKIKGDGNHPKITGMVSFFEVYGGTVVSVEVKGLRDDNFHGFHIHAGSTCTGTKDVPFQNADGHYNPNKTGHPDHAGDLPPVLANNGNVWMMFYTTRFCPEDIIGKTVVIHEKRDDFKTQPSGDAGAMIACGEIVEMI